MKMLIGENWVDQEKKIEVLNPYNNDLVDTVPSGDNDDVEAAFKAAEEGYKVSRNLPVHQRISILYKTAEIIRSRQEDFAKTIATEGSKTIKELEVGGVMINDSTDYRIDMMPFGGVKWSGLGREGIKFALLEMTEPKVVCFNL